ncbi:MAG: SDR family oxidoreductase [Gammaproteobacteria bacterium]|nr:SDR family oxidoreductase [Gammaproteobacteria bacterium]
MSDNMLEGKVAIVTGSGRGIGRGIALEMAKEGAKVVVNDIGGSVSGEGSDATPAEEVVAEIRAMGGEAVTNTDSVSSWDSAEKIIQCALDNFGRVDAVVNNAGILRDRIFHKMSEEEFESVLSVHLKGAFFVSRAAIAHFRKQDSGSFVHFTSTSGLIGGRGQVNYGAAKAGIMSLSRNIAMEMDMMNANINSNCIAPFAWSRMIGTIPSNTPEEQARLEKLKEMKPEKIAPVVAYLASDAGRKVSGQIFAIRANEIFLMSQPRPVRSAHSEHGWTAKKVGERAMAAFEGNFTPLERSNDVFSWDPI